MSRSIFTLFAFVILFCSCNRKVSTSDIRVLNKDTQGLIIVQTEGEGINLLTREQDAQYKILNEIIFNGIPSEKISDVRLPLVDRRETLNATQQAELNELLSEKNRNKYFSSFTKNKNSKNFNSKNNRIEQFTGKLRLDLLRTDLENKGVIRKFGY